MSLSSDTIPNSYISYCFSLSISACRDLTASYLSILNLFAISSNCLEVFGLVACSKKNLRISPNFPFDSWFSSIKITLATFFYFYVSCLAKSLTKALHWSILFLPITSKASSVRLGHPILAPYTSFYHREDLYPGLTAFYICEGIFSCSKILLMNGPRCLA